MNQIITGLLCIVLALAVLAFLVAKAQLQAHHARHAEEQRCRNCYVAREMELDPRYQMKVQADRRWLLDREEAALKRFLALSRIDTSQYGTYLLDADPQRLLHLAPVYKPAMVKQGDERTDVPLSIMAPSFASMIPEVRDGRWCLGYGETGPLYGTIDDLLSTAIVGRPGTGKTTLLRFVCAQLLKVGGQPMIWDPHANIADEVGDLLDCSVEPQEIVRSARQLERLLEHRLKERRQGRPTPRTLLLLADEWPVIASLAAGAIDVIKRIVLEGRKVGMYALISGQGLPAKLLDGTLVRDALSSRYVFNTTAQQARLAGLDNETANNMLALLDTAGPGRAILASSRLKPEVIAVPDTTVEDMRSCLNGNSRPQAWEAAGDVPEQSAFFAPDVPLVSSQEREQIVNLYQQGVPRREICGALGRGNAYYPIVKSVLDAYESEEA